MNYCIQGDAAKADQIKAAFEKLGYSTRGWCFSTNDTLYYTTEEKRIDLACSKFLINLIKTHPDYKELELPVEPKFKVGDWIACDADSFTLSIKSVRDANYYFHQGASLPIKDIDEHYHLWTIADAKDGDVLFSLDSKQPFIYKERPQFSQAIGYCCINKFGEFGVWYTSKCVICTDKYIPATKEQRDLLFTKMREAGYEWDAYKKELRKIKPHYDIANFKPFDKVLTRDTEHGHWNVNLFSYYIDDKDERVIARFRCINSLWKQCIPFNEKTEHLLGTTDMPSEEYINW